MLLKERAPTDGRVVVAGCVATERLHNRWPCCRLPWCCFERLITVGRVVVAGCVAEKRLTPVAVLLLPVLLTSAKTPLAVLLLPVVLP